MGPVSLALIECRLKQGGPIRYIGHGLVGDPLYGGRRKIPSKSFSEDIVRNYIFPRRFTCGEFGLCSPKIKRDFTFKPLPDDR